MEFDVVAFADADEASWNVPAESPEEVVGTIVELLDDFANLEFDDDFGSVFARDGWRNIRRLCEDGNFFTLDCRIDDFLTVVRPNDLAFGCEGLRRSD